MAAARPFLATPVGANQELAVSDEMIVPVGDPEQLAMRLVAFLTEPALAGELGRRGRELCIATRSPEVIDRRLREVYAGVRAAKRP
jgi:glycosyltransferase involved in cell wall biosynthesis